MLFSATRPSVFVGVLIRMELKNKELGRPVYQAVEWWVITYTNGVTENKRKPNWKSLAFLKYNVRRGFHYGFYYERPHFYAYPSAFFVFDYLADLTKCQKERKTALGPLGSAPPGRFAPECDDSGKYNKMQCYSVTDNCWCVDSRGLEIPGTRNKGRVSCPDKGLSLMLFTCCSAKSKKRKRTVPVLVFFFPQAPLQQEM